MKPTMTEEQALACYTAHAPPHLLDQLRHEQIQVARGATLTCASGSQYIDLASGGFGYGHAQVRERVVSQVKKAALSSRVLISRPLAELACELARVAPGELEVSYVCSSAEESLDGALKLVKGYHTKRERVVVASGGDYGTLSHGTYFAGHGQEYLRRLPFVPEHVPFADLERTLAAIDESTAAVLLEPISLAGGPLCASDEFWSKLRERCDATGALLLVNESRTCLGRTGRLLAVERHGVVPDVLILGGALGGGMISVGAYVTKEALNSRVYARRNPTLHGSTTGANPASCAAALAALAIAEEQDFAATHRAFGEQLRALGARLGERTGALRLVQTLGSLALFEFTSQKRALRACAAAERLGLWLRTPENGRLSLQLPLSISHAEFALAIERLERAVELSEQPELAKEVA